MTRVVAAAIAAVALSSCGPMDPVNEDAPPQELAQQEHALTVSIYCSANYGAAHCYATPAGGTGPYTFTWGSYNPYATITSSGNQASVRPPSRGGQLGVRVDITDSLGAYAAGFTYASCY